ncbi:MAG: aminoglycoside phosphotransferase family protein [Actinobacteria bacterium]|nr:MAG: aminoglycoside phosphotransferase family protein [Actinomycetota bacterium]REK39781.1 MAG: aminoglycoside phosphotransferase family protein [Actinomycetota bacterium]
MNARELVESSHPNTTLRELSAGANKVFRVIDEKGGSIVVKVYPVPSRERRERRALESLEGTPGVPTLIDSGVSGDLAWISMTDGGNWNLGNLPKNLDAVEAAGEVLRGVHQADAEITNLATSIDDEYVESHYQSTITRLGRFRRRFGLDQRVLDAALEMTPPHASQSVTAHTRPTPSKFVVNEEGAVTLVDWEWATLAPPEWDLTLAVWRFADSIGEDAAAAFRSGYGAELAESSYRPWVAYHAATMMLDAAEVREGRLGDLKYLVDDLTEAVLGT